MAPQGVESVAQFLWSQSRVQPLPHHRLDRLDQVGGVWLAESGGAGKREEFDMVLLTLPVPQFAGTYHPNICTYSCGSDCMTKQSVHLKMKKKKKKNFIT